MGIGTFVVEGVTKAAKFTESGLEKMFPKLIPKLRHPAAEVVAKAPAKGWWGKIKSNTPKIMGTATAGFGIFSVAKGAAGKSLDGVLDGLSMLTAAASFIPGVNIFAAVIQMTISVPRFIGSLAAGKGLKVATLKACADGLFGAAELIPGGGLVRLGVGLVGAGGMSWFASSAEEKQAAKKAEAAQKMSSGGVASAPNVTYNTKAAGIANAVETSATVTGDDTSPGAGRSWVKTVEDSRARPAGIVH